MRYNYCLLLTAFLCLFLFPEVASAASEREEQSSVDIFNQLMEHRKVVMGMVSATMSFIGLGFYLAVRHKDKRAVREAQDSDKRQRQSGRQHGPYQRENTH